MTQEITQVSVIGSGVMGSAIAAHIANAGIPVILVDIVPQGASDKNILSKKAIERYKDIDPTPLTHRSKLSLITPGNLEEPEHAIGRSDWIIEAVLEDINVKHKVYAIIEQFRKKSSIVSSNTSTIPLKSLVDGLSEQFKQDFLISHFFNPPRYMRLLELVGSEYTRQDALDTIKHLCDEKLGKTVVSCNDTPGFIANRIGCYWLVAAVNEAIASGVTPEEADAIMSKPFGIPKTGVFGLLDLIGIDLMPLIAKSFFKNLNAMDLFCKDYKEHPLITKMISDGYTGRKGKGGFYRLRKEGEKKIKEVINLQSGEYHLPQTPQLASLEASKQSLRSLLEHPDKGGRYAYRVMLKTLSYAASLIPEIASSIDDVDTAMRTGYNWKYGPFQLIDRLKSGDMAGAAWLASALVKEGIQVPPLLSAVANQHLYTILEQNKLVMELSGQYSPIKKAKDAWMLEDKKIGRSPVAKNASASLWDIGDGVVCLEYTSKMNAVDPFTLEMITKAIDIVEKDFGALVIGNDSDNFCVGANLGFLLFSANMAGWKMVDNVLKQGQDAYMALKYAPFPVVTAVSGMALGGGCEILLHSDAVQAHIETYTGLVEVGVGVIPAWGGCKEMILRHQEARLHDQRITAKLGRMFQGFDLIKTANTMPTILNVFQSIALARVSKSAEEAREMKLLNSHSAITMNRLRLLPDAKKKAISLMANYKPPVSMPIYLPGKTAKTALHMGINNYVKSGKATAHDEIVSKALALVLSGGDTDIGMPLTEQQVLDLERLAFMELIRTRGTLDRIDHMLETGKPLRN